MKKNLIIYETYYGTSKKVAEIFSLILGNAKVLDIKQATVNINRYENIILVFAFHGYETAEKTKEYLKKNSYILMDKNIALIGVGLNRKDIDNYSKDICSVLERKANIIEFIQGELRVNKLTEDDKKILEEFLTKANIKLMDMGKFKISEACNIALKCRGILNKPSIILDKDKLKSSIDKFIKDHNTCTLATGYNNFIRATPIEYVYIGGDLYFITEGGVKFNGILQNPNVSICIYESYTGMNNLKGLQIGGEAEIVDIGSDEYKKIIKEKGVDGEKLKKLPVNLNMIKVKINVFEFLNSDFKKMCVDVKQILDVKS
ncbi:MAG: flavodoxin domain-containing protein [Clostridium perfringens]|nr:flavodoxin domain-containing protein [Clostridium perfringens]